MQYSACAFGRDTELSIEREGLRTGGSFLYFADFKAIRPLNHRVFIDTLSGETVEISMLGFSYDGFLKELTDSFADRSMQALFAGEEPIMRCEGEYSIPEERGRGTVILLPDAICILPMTWRAVRIPLCFVREIRPEGYLIHILLRSGAEYTVGRMGYDTKPFAERAITAAELTKKKRAQALAKRRAVLPYTHSGLFRTEQPELYWTAAIQNGRCAVELFTGEDTATYLYRFTEPEDVFLQNLEEATEAVGIHRELIYLAQDELEAKPLYRMSVMRSAAVRYLRAQSAGRLIHTKNHDTKLNGFLAGEEI